MHVETSFPKETGLPGGSILSSGEQRVVGARVWSAQRSGSSKHISFQLITSQHMLRVMVMVRVRLSTC